MVRLKVYCLGWLLFWGTLFLGAQPRMFTHIGAFDGLSDNKIQHILQLPDGRMVFTTPHTINFYDGARFRYFTSRPQDRQLLPAYRGAYHVYLGEGDRLWVKNFRTISCFDVRTEQYLPHLQRLIRQLNNSEVSVVDLFLDTEKTIWLVRQDGSVWNTRLKKAFKFPSAWGTLQDLEVKNGDALFFFNTGFVANIPLKTSRLSHASGERSALASGVKYVSAAYPPSERKLYDRMSLVVPGPDGHFYQLRNGRKAICLRLDPASGRWKTLLRTPYILHTLLVPTRDKAYITCGKGLWKLDLRRDASSYVPSLQMAEGSSITTDINTVFEDRAGGWWLGTSDKGLLYGHPWRDAFTRGENLRNTLGQKTFRPILINIAIDGKPVAVRPDEKEVLLPQGAPFVRHLNLKSDQNTIAFDFSALNYALPMQTCYRYRLISRTDSAWHTIVFSQQSKAIDEKGVLHLPFSRLTPGDYRLQVAAGGGIPSDNAPVTEVTFTVQVPWWQTTAARILYIVLALLLFGMVFSLYRHRQDRRRKEQLLLARIKDLIERCNRYEAERAVTDGAGQLSESPSSLNPQDEVFLQKAISLVKKHLDSPYSVEALSRDLCMERTGLYKKLTALLDQSPSLFIRNIRLQQAARLLLEKRQSISEIALETGFSSASYFSKCFQEMYGCKPSEYGEKQ